METKQKRPVGRTLMILAIIFFYAPIVFMMIFSFNSSKSLTRFTGFSLRWYAAMLKNHTMMEALYVTVFVAVAATIISTVIGTLTAIGLSQASKPIRRYVETVNDLPLMNPDIVTAIGLMLLFITMGITKGLWTMLLAHIAFCIPYVILSVMPKVRALDPNLAEAAMDLGATPRQAVTQVIIPQIMPGIISGALIAFTMSIDDFIISYFVTGVGVKNLSIMVYTMSKRVNPSVNAIFTLFVLAITVLMVVVNVIPLIREKTKAKKVTEDFVAKKRWPVFVAPGAAVCVLIASMFGMMSSSSSASFAGQTLYIYMPGEYLAEDVVTTFEEETGAKVVVDNFDSNEQMYISVANGSRYDILIPSDYMIQRLIQEDFLQELDQTQVAETFNLCNESILNLAYDPGNVYSVPYFWGSVGIAYDKTKVTLKELEEEGFAIFLDEKFKGDIYLYDSERDSFMMALKALGYSMNTSDAGELREAYDWWIKCVTTMEPEIVMDEIIDNMAACRKALGLIYSGDATYAMSENENVGYYMPEEGTNIWTDGMVIPKNARNVPLAYAFMNYINSDEAARVNSEYVGYTTPNLAVAEELASTTFKGINAYSPREGYDKDEVFEFNEKTRKTIANLWSGVKIAASNA